MSAGEKTPSGKSFIVATLIDNSVGVALIGTQRKPAGIIRTSFDNYLKASQIVFLDVFHVFLFCFSSFSFLVFILLCFFQSIPIKRNQDRFY